MKWLGYPLLLLPSAYSNNTETTRHKYKQASFYGWLVARGITAAPSEQGGVHQPWHAQLQNAPYCSESRLPTNTWFLPSPLESTQQTAHRSIQLFLQRLQLCPTDTSGRHMDHRTSMTLGHILCHTECGVTKNKLTFTLMCASPHSLTQCVIYLPTTQQLYCNHRLSDVSSPHFERY